MAGRFTNIDGYLPPAAEPSEVAVTSLSEPALDEGPRIVAPGGRRRPGRLVEMISLGVAAAAAAVLALGSLESVPPETSKTPDEVVPATAPFPRPRSGPAGRVAGLSRPEDSKQRRRPAKARHRHKQPRAPVTVVLPPDPQPAAGSKSRKRSRPAKRTREDRVALPSPPGTPLFHCYSRKRRSHYMTVDPAAVGQLEDSRADYDCLVVGNVYTRSGRGRTAIRLDEGVTVWLLRESDVATRPPCSKTALYLHSSPTDAWYSRAPDGGSLAGYACS